MRHLALLVLFLAVPAASAQTTRYVDPAGADSGDCADPAAPCRTVAYALGQAVDGDTILLAAGIYTEDGGLFIDKDVTLAGAGQDATFVQEATTAASADARIVTIPVSTEVTIRDLTLRHSIAVWIPPPGPPGPYAYGGGAIRNDSRLSLFRVTVTDNNRYGVPGPAPRIDAPQLRGGSFSGGGINNKGILHMEDCLVQRNEAMQDAGGGGDGGGIYNAQGGVLTVERCDIRDNSGSRGGVSGGRGGGIYNAGSATVTMTEVVGNTSGFGVFTQDSGDGGGLYNAGNMLLDDVVVAENRTLDVLEEGGNPTGAGGGIYNAAEGSLTIRNAGITENRTGSGPGVYQSGECADAGHGGGLYNEGTLTVERSRIEHNVTGDGGNCDDNTYGGSGGGLYLAGGTATISESTIHANAVGDGFGLDLHDGDGGGIVVMPDAALTLDASTVSENDGKYGHAGGVFTAGTTRILNSTISGNEARWGFPDGATGLSNNGHLDLEFSTITANGSGPSSIAAFSSQRVARLRGTIIAGNHGMDCQGNKLNPGIGVESFGYNLIGRHNDDDAYGCAEAFPPGLPNANGDYVGTDDAPLDALLGPLADHGGPTLTHALDAGSPAIDHGVCADLGGAPVEVDQRGYTRVAPCDIGAFEHDGIPTGAAPAADVPGTHVLTAAYPNPFNPRTAFTLGLAEAQPVTVTLFDALGRRVARLHDGPLGAGTQRRFEVDGARLASGVYVVVVEGETFRDYLRLTLVR